MPMVSMETKRPRNDVCCHTKRRGIKMNEKWWVREETRWLDEMRANKSTRSVCEKERERERWSKRVRNNVVEGLLAYSKVRTRRDVTRTTKQHDGNWLTDSSCAECVPTGLGLCAVLCRNSSCHNQEQQQLWRVAFLSHLACMETRFSLPLSYTHFNTLIGPVVGTDRGSSFVRWLATEVGHTRSLARVSALLLSSTDNNAAAAAADVAAVVVAAAVVGRRHHIRPRRSCRSLALSRLVMMAAATAMVVVGHRCQCCHWWHHSLMSTLYYVWLIWIHHGIIDDVHTNDTIDQIS